MNYREEIIRTDGLEATLQLYLWENQKDYHVGKKRPILLICPGGGYKFVAGDENQTMAYRFLQWGYHTAVLNYSVRPNPWPIQLHQLALSVALIREHADEWFVDPDKITVVGFSAGGSLAGELGVHWHEPELAAAVGKTNEDIRPNALVLGYAVLALDRYPQRNTVLLDVEERKQMLKSLKPGSREADAPVHYVSEHTPPTFLWHTFEDTSVPMESSLYFAQAMYEYQLPFELHIYEKGKHGLCLATDVSDNYKGLVDKSAAMWTESLKIWLNELFGDSQTPHSPLYEYSNCIGHRE